MDYDTLLTREPFSLSHTEKRAVFSDGLTELTRYHRTHCPPYAALLDRLGVPDGPLAPEDIPFLPVSVFKDLELKSIPEDQVFKTITSSGTTGQRVSRIFLDAGTSANQQKTLFRITSALVGTDRLPMLVIDSKKVLRDRAMFSARGAGILGFSIFGSPVRYALNDDMELDLEAVNAFLEQYRGRKILLFGFTFMIWKHFCRALREKGITLDFGDSVLIHGGGWKKLINEAVSPGEFNRTLRDLAGIRQVADYYGMAEQTGCIYLECPQGHLHASAYSDVLFRRPSDHGLCQAGEPGVIQVLSLLPRSYPGHSLLTEDMGILLGEDDCPCGWRGKYFSVTGRIPKAEVRGCSDTYGG